jgi:predicted Fe-Mo cluster-binding NifX family protein
MNRMKRFEFWLVAAAIVMMAAPAWAEDARIAVAAEAAHAEAPISAVAARAPHILIFDAKGALTGSHPNPAAAEPGSAGPALARWLAEQKVGTLIAGDFGAKLAQALEERRIRAVIASGPAALAVKETRR